MESVYILRTIIPAIMNRVFINGSCYILRTIIPAIINRVCINGSCLHFENHNTCHNEQSVYKWKMFTF